MDPLTLQALNRLAVALASLVLNLGARHLPASLSPRLQMITSSKGMRMLVVFALFFLSTRDPMLSVALASLFFVLVSTVLHEDSKFSVLPTLVRPKVMSPNPVPITNEAYNLAVDTILNFRRQARARAPGSFAGTLPVLSKALNLDGPVHP